LKLTAFEIGERALAPIETAWRVGDAEIQTLKTDEKKIRVLSYLEKVKAEEGEAATTLRPVKPPLELPRGRAWLWWIPAILVGLALAALLARRLARGRGGAAPARSRVAPLPSPDEEALLALAKLELENAAEKETAKSFYSSLSWILRRYLSRRYRFDALEMTSRELMERAQELYWDAELLEALRRELGESDGVKFAQYAPPVSRRKEALLRVRDIVSRTRPRETAVPANVGTSPKEVSA
jgi:hypothetical protein